MALVKQQGVVTRRIMDETLLIPTSGKLADLERVYVLHGIGDYIWERLDGTRDVDALVGDVTERFDVERGEADGDVRGFLEQLAAAGLAREEG